MDSVDVKMGGVEGSAQNVASTPSGMHTSSAASNLPLESQTPRANECSTTPTATTHVGGPSGTADSSHQDAFSVDELRRQLLRDTIAENAGPSQPPIVTQMEGLTISGVAQQANEAKRKRTSSTATGEMPSKSRGRLLTRQLPRQSSRQLPTFNYDEFLRKAGMVDDDLEWSGNLFFEGFFDFLFADNSEVADRILSPIQIQEASIWAAHLELGDLVLYSLT